MKIVQPYAKVISIGDGRNNPLTQIEYAARISHRSEDSMTDTTTERFIRSVVVAHGDWSVVEHVSASVEMLVDRGITHELVRHRIASYTQESTRFVNYEKKMPPSFIYPIPEVQCEHCLVDVSHQSADFGYEDYEAVSRMHHGIIDDTAVIECAYNKHWLCSVYIEQNTNISNF